MDHGVLDQPVQNPGESRLPAARCHGGIQFLREVKQSLVLSVDAADLNAIARVPFKHA
jgi:hypothetical protein